MNKTVRSNIQKSVAKRIEQKAEWEASFHGIQIHTDPSLALGEIELRDRAGNLLGTLVDVGGVRIGTHLRE